MKENLAVQYFLFCITFKILSVSDSINLNYKIGKIYPSFPNCVTTGSPRLTTIYLATFESCNTTEKKRLITSSCTYACHTVSAVT